MNELIVIIFAVTMLYVSATSRVEAYIRAIAIQGFLLFLLVVIDYRDASLPGLLFLSFETIIVKGVLIPVFLLRIVRRWGILREIEPYIPNFFSVLISSLIFAVGLYFAYWSADTVPPVKSWYFGISISTIITGLFIIITRKKLITHVMGYMMLENGIFLLSLSVAQEMPFIVALGVLLDIFIAVFLLGLFVGKIQHSYHAINIDRLTLLKD